MQVLFEPAAGKGLAFRSDRNAHSVRAFPSGSQPSWRASTNRIAPSKR